MHSFRLRYIVLGLLIYIQSAFCRTCGSDFEDVTSRAILADVVLEGTAKRAGQLESSHYNVTFHVRKPFKGENGLRTVSSVSTRKKYEPIIVGTFGPEDKDLCIKPINVGSQYVLFLKRTSDGSYYRMSGFPEPMSRKTVKLVKAGLCQKCVKRPNAKISAQLVNVEKGKKIQIKCRVSGKPPPLVRWFKDDVPITQDKKKRHYQIKNNRRGSRLRIRKAKPEDSGTYTCQAVSAGGKRSANSVVTVQSVDTSTPDHARKCDQQTFCLNGGTCYELNMDGAKTGAQKVNSERTFCRCSQGFVGARCQDKDITYILKELESREIHHWDRTLTITGLVICALVVVGIFVLSYCLARRKKKLFLKKKEAKMQSLHQKENAATKKPLLDCKEKNSIELQALTPTPPRVVTGNTGTQTDISGLLKTPEVVVATDKLLYCQPPPIPNHLPQRPPPHDLHHPDHQPHRRHVQEQLAYEAQRRHSNPNQRDSGHRSSHHRDYGRHDPGHRDLNPSLRDPTRRDSGHRDSGRRDSGHRAYDHRDSGHHDPGRWSSGHPDPPTYIENGPYDSGYRDSGHDDSGYRNSGHIDPSHRDTGPRNSGRRNSGQRDPRSREPNVYGPHRRSSGSGQFMHGTPEPHIHHPQSRHCNSPEQSPVTLPHVNMSPSASETPQHSGNGRPRLPAISGVADRDRPRRQSAGNVEVVSAVVEMEPNSMSKMNTPKVDLSLENNSPKQQSMEDSVESKASLSLDLDQQSDYDNQASDMEVNLESEADIHALDASGDEVEGPGGGLGSGQAEDSDSSPTSETESSSGIDEERALFQQMAQNPLLNSRNNSRTNSRSNSLTQLPSTEEQQAGVLPGWEHYGNQSPVFAQLGATYPFNSPYAEPFTMNNDVIANRYFHDKHNTPRRKKKEVEQIREFPYDPDPDATVV